MPATRTDPPLHPASDVCHSRDGHCRRTEDVIRPGRRFTNLKWAQQIGIELYTVRDLMENDFEGTLAKLAALGYREVEPANGYNNMSARRPSVPCWNAMA